MWSTEYVPGEPGLYRETSSQKIKERKKEKKERRKEGRRREEGKKRREKERKRNERKAKKINPLCCGL